MRRQHSSVMQYTIMLGAQTHNPTLLQIWLSSQKMSLILHSKLLLRFFFLCTCTHQLLNQFHLSCCNLLWHKFMAILIPYLFLISIFYTQFPLLRASSRTLHSSRGKAASEPQGNSLGAGYPLDNLLLCWQLSAYSHEQDLVLRETHQKWYFTSFFIQFWADPSSNQLKVDGSGSGIHALPINTTFLPSFSCCSQWICGIPVSKIWKPVTISIPLGISCFSVAVPNWHQSERSILLFHML